MADLVCSPSAAVAYDFFVGKGLQNFQSAAIVGNLQQESRLNPHAVSPPDPVHPSRGVAQWQPAGWDKLLAFASSIGRDPWSLNTQLEFIWYQLETEPYLGLNELRGATTIEAAVVIFQNKFERPKAALAATQNRISYAQSALYACPAIVPPTPAPAVSKRGSIIAATIGVAALVSAAGYGAYRWLSGRPEPRPLPPPEPTYPMFRRYEP